MGNYTNKCSLFFTWSNWKPNEWIYQAITFFILRSLVVLYYHWEGVKSQCHSFNLHSTLAMQIYVNSCHRVWLLIGWSFMPLQKTQSLTPNLHSLTGDEKGKQRRAAFYQLTSPAWQPSDIRKTATHDSVKNMYGWHELWGPGMDSERQIKDNPGASWVFLYCLHHKWK